MSFITSPEHNACDPSDELPVVSPMGKGPRGSGVVATVSKNDPGTFSFRLATDLGETIFQSPNLSAGILNIQQIDEGNISIKLDRDGVKTPYPIKLPSGVVGSRIFTLEKIIPKAAISGNLITLSNADLVWSSHSVVTPNTRVQDVVIFSCEDKTGISVVIGTIVQKDGDNVTVLCRTSADIPYPDVVENSFLLFNVATGFYRANGSYIALPDLPDFSSTIKGDAFLVKEDVSSTTIDIYMHLAGGTTWTILRDWGQGGLTRSVKVNGTTYTQVGGLVTLPDYPTVPTIWSGTQVAYDAIVTKDANTLYLIVG